MKKNLRNLFNKLFPEKDNLLSEFIIKIYYYSGYPFYLLSIFFNKPYIGSYLFSDQESGRERLKIIYKIINSNLKNNRLNILELGVYCGQNTINIYSCFPKMNVNHYCVDIFKEFEISKKNNTFQYTKIFNSLKNKNVFKLFQHNINSVAKSKKNYSFFIKKMTTKKFFKHNRIKFDLILIDASHQFQYVYQDIKSSIKCLNKNGIIIGDDYELEAKKNSIKNLEKIKNIDTVYDKKNKVMYHPGVTLAIKYIFKNLKSKNGLFAVKKNSGKHVDLFDK